MKFLANFLEGKCVQCLVDDYKLVVEICSCGIELCEKHAYFHKFEQHIRYPVEICKDGNKVYAKIKTKDCSMIEGLLEVLKCKSLVEMSCQASQECRLCMHVFKVFKEMARIANQISQIVVYYKSSECCICSLQENRWMCIACGLVFCGRVRHDAKGEGHAYQHFTKTQHPLFVSMDDFSPVGQEMLAFCCFCGVFIKDEIICEIFSCRYIAASGCLGCNSENSGSSLKCFSKDDECSSCFKLASFVLQSVPSKRAPEYALSVIQAISYCILNVVPKDFLNDFFSKETGVEFKDAVNKVFAKMLSMYSLRQNRHVFVDHVEKFVNGSFERCNDNNTRMDAARFFRNFMSLLKRIEVGSTGTTISNLFYILLRSSITCGECREKWEKSEKVCILYLKPNQTVSEYFAIKQLDKICKCGAKTKTVVTCLTNTPNILTIRLKRPVNFILGENTCTKIEKELSIPYKSFDKKNEFVLSHDDKAFLSLQKDKISDDDSSESELISSDLIHKLKEFLMYPQHSTPNKQNVENFKEKTSFLSYKLKASIICQNNNLGEYYFMQVLDKCVSANKNNSKYIDSALWDTYIDEKIIKQPLFKEDAILLFYIRTDNRYSEIIP